MKPMPELSEAANWSKISDHLSAAAADTAASSNSDRWKDGEELVRRLRCSKCGNRGIGTGLDLDQITVPKDSFLEEPKRERS